jgi:hypothetical protein
MQVKVRRFKVRQIDETSFTTNSTRQEATFINNEQKN